VHPLRHHAGHEETTRNLRNGRPREVWASKAALKDRNVVVRGKVVKFLPSIMGKNWLHVRDGSGTHAKGDDDICVISDDTTAVGSVVTLTGTVRVDKDFGAGYSYPVIIDGAKLK
jgi:hypothetical protein